MMEAASVIDAHGEIMSRLLNQKIEAVTIPESFAE